MHHFGCTLVPVLPAAWNVNVMGGAAAVMLHLTATLRKEAKHWHAGLREVWVPGDGGAKK